MYLLQSLKRKTSVCNVYGNHHPIYKQLLGSVTKTWEDLGEALGPPEGCTVPFVTELTFRRGRGEWDKPHGDGVLSGCVWGSRAPPEPQPNRQQAGGAWSRRAGQAASVDVHGRLQASSGGGGRGGERGPPAGVAPAESCGCHREGLRHRPVRPVSSPALPASSPSLPPTSPCWGAFRNDLLGPWQAPEGHPTWPMGHNLQQAHARRGPLAPGNLCLDNANAWCLRLLVDPQGVGTAAQSDEG